ncbi:Beta-ketoadipate enol-lactone hydrolase [Caballeronia sordidicola]|uniref:Beta-ketoadipate enol-lactone hydrolase n=2 Tax=Caballeronia sordidicola TaxID=196367 RepID=A0A242MXP1_CABSO|nr:Beta-ketoadipate enol-lactone hydrolase [Caballeronia sordidicola]
MEKEVTAHLKHLPPRFFIAGFSLGGIVAFEFYRQARERIAGLALIASNARSDPDASKLKRHNLVAQAKRGDIAGVLQNELLPKYFSELCENREALSDLIVAMATATAPRFENQSAYAGERPDSRVMLSSMHVPVLILFGRDDRVVPRERQTEMAAAMPHAVMQEVARCGHFVPLEAPNACSLALQRWMGSAED